MSAQSHHRGDGRFRNPWPSAAGEQRRSLDFFKWQWQRLRNGRSPRPDESVFPRALARLAMPRAAAAETRITWIGHATFLIQTGQLNILTDPHWSQRASPVQWLGPKRLTQPGVALEALPPIDAVLISHDHYDHLDAPTVRQLARRFPGAHWIAPLKHASFLRRLGVAHMTELDWWEQAVLDDTAITAAPAQHWTRRAGSAPAARLWCSFAIRSPQHNLYFAADSGYCPAFAEIGRRLGPFDVAMLPIGAYEPRWFMKTAHMNPEEAVRACGDLRAGRFIAMHWATFRLADEPPLEPPQRIAQAWAAAGNPAGALHVVAIGETLVLEAD